MPTVESELVDTGVVYCTGDDVFTYIRNKTYGDLGANTKPTQTQVDNLIARMSEKVDKYTGRAWRIRKVHDLTTRVEFSHMQKQSRHRRRRLRSKGRVANFRAEERGLADLPHIHIRPIDANKDKIEILNPNSADDITANEGRQDGDYVVDERKGLVRPNLRLFVPVTTSLQGPSIDDGKVRVTYRYGRIPNGAASSDADNDGIADAVPGDVREATAKWVAADLIASDQYGELVPQGGDGTPSLADAANRMETQAKDTLKNYRRIQ